MSFDGNWDGHMLEETEKKFLCLWAKLMVAGTITQLQQVEQCRGAGGGGGAFSLLGEMNMNN